MKTANTTTSTTAMQNRGASIIETSRSYLGVGNTLQPLRVGSLCETTIAAALMEGRHIHYRDWTIQATPARSIPTADGQGGREWVAGLIASSVHGFTTALRIDPRNIAFICHYIRQRDTAVTVLSLEGHHHEREEAEEIDA